MRVKYQYEQMLNFRLEVPAPAFGASVRVPRPTVDPSRLRGLVRDACRCLGQQMVYWGCDARHAGGNLLPRFGMERLARAERGSEGSSRYRMACGNGAVELHSFCAGWHPANGGDGVLFIRNRERLHGLSGGAAPLMPGHFDDERLRGAAPDEMLWACRPLQAWLLSYERWIEARTEPGYRARCWTRHVARMGGKPWLAPGPAVFWLKKFLADPASTPRARELSRPKKTMPPRPFRLAGTLFR